MKILLIHQYFLGKSEGGGSRFNELTRLWSEKGHNITILAGMVNYATGVKSSEYKGKFTLIESISDNVKVIRCHVSEAYNKNFIGRLWAYFSFVFSSIYAGLFKIKEKHDIILVTSPPLFVGITGFILSRVKRIPFVFEVRDLWPESAIDAGVLTSRPLIKLSLWFEKFIYNKAENINVLTPAFRDVLLEKKNIDPAKVIFIPNAADFSIVEKVSNGFIRDEFRKVHGFDDNLVIIYVGAHGVANHLVQLIEVAELLKNEKVLFVSIGAGMQQPFLSEEVKKRKLNNIKFLGPVSKEEIFKFILASDIGTSVLKKVDTFKTVYSNKTFDYMACRKPILMVIDGVSRKLVEEAECGFYVEPENPEEFAAKINNYLNNPNLLILHGQNGYNFAIKNFDRRILANKYLDKLHSIILKNV